MNDRDKSLDLEKMKIDSRLKTIEGLVTDALNLNKKMYVKIYGDAEAEPPILGHEARLKYLEGAEAGREKQKKELIKLAIGSFTIAVGGIILWILAALKTAFIKGH